jgi:hypothetical protein
MPGVYSATSFRTLGAGATTQNLFTIENALGSLIKVKLKRLNFLMDATATMTAVMPAVKVVRLIALPSAGTTLVKAQFNTTTFSSTNVVVRGANASDGGVASAITATAGAVLWLQMGMRLHTLVGQVLAPDNNILPSLCENAGYEVILNANEALGVVMVAAAGTSNPATNHYIVEAVWEEV